MVKMGLDLIGSAGEKDDPPFIRKGNLGQANEFNLRVTSGNTPECQ
jgi:hypothetical protein